MKIIAAKCPNCGADIEVDQYSDKTRCEYCNSTIIVEDAIACSKVDISGNITIDNSKEIEMLLKNANRLFDSHDYKNAYIKYDKVLDANPDDLEAIIKSEGCRLLQMPALEVDYNDFIKIIDCIDDYELDEEDNDYYYGIALDVLSDSAVVYLTYDRPLRTEVYKIYKILWDLEEVFEELFDNVHSEKLEKKCARRIVKICEYISTSRTPADSLFPCPSPNAKEARKQFEKYSEYLDEN